jgi:hypothetical protein
VTRPIFAGPFSDADLFSIYMMRVFGMLGPGCSQRVGSV